MSGLVSGAREVDREDEIRLSLPAIAAYARVARVAVTGLATRIGFSYDEIEDLRIAVGEVCGVLLHEEGGRLTLQCVIGADALTIDTIREPAEPRPIIGDLSRQILTAVVDEVEIDAGQARIRVVKRRRG